MLKARKKNRVIRIPDEKAEEYKSLGYRITDMDGNTVYEPEDKDATIDLLQKENLRLKGEIAELKMLLGKPQGEESEAIPKKADKKTEAKAE